MKAQIGQPVPLLSISTWVQGETVNLDQLLGHVILVEVFQVNCPGCFLYALPQAIELYERYNKQGLTVLGLATAFEDFDKNNLENLMQLVNTGTVVGETLKTLTFREILIEGRLPYQMPFPLAMDTLTPHLGHTEDDIQQFIDTKIPNFNQLPTTHQQQIRQSVEQYFQNLKYHAQTFECFGLKGTPSQILVDKHGILREIDFGQSPDLEDKIKNLLQEK